MTVTVIISTYNHPKWLEKVLWGYECQSYENFNIIIADDGSGDETLTVIKKFISASKLNISHCWHEDNGFQKTRILNKALQQAQGEYIIITDGDCIPRKDFIETHVRHAEAGYLLSGGYCKLSLETSRMIHQENITKQECFDLKWLKRNGLSGMSQKLKVGLPPSLAKLADMTTPTKATWNGMNASAYLTDILAVNGFNEDMRYGGLDRELGERLANLGLKPKQIRHRAICLHLHHKRGYKNTEDTKANLARRKAVIDQGIIQCENGIEKLNLKSSTENI